MLARIKRNADGSRTLNSTVPMLQVPIGTILSFSSDKIPTGYLLCDGAQYSISEYNDLYNTIGTLYNLSTDDSTTVFRVPDLRNKTVFGVGTATGGLPNLGNSTVGSLPNIVGTFETGMGRAGTGPFSGSFPNIGHNQNNQSTYWLDGTISFDAARCSSMYKTTSQVVPASVGTNFIIKY